MNGPLQPHPETQALVEEIELLREELAHLLTEEHELLHIAKPNLLAIYQQKIGLWEMRALQADIALRRTRRKLELAQAAVNCGKLPDWTEIESGFGSACRMLMTAATSRNSAPSRSSRRSMAPSPRHPRNRIPCAATAKRWKTKSRKCCAASNSSTASRPFPCAGNCPTRDGWPHGVRRSKPVLPGATPNAQCSTPPSNVHDDLAIMMLDETGHHLGYVPRAKNEALARLMDAGKFLFAKLENKEWLGDWLKIEARIYLRDF